MHLQRCLLEIKGSVPHNHLHHCWVFSYVPYSYMQLNMHSSSVCLFNRCNVDNKVSRVAWLNRTTILFTGNEKWSLDPRVVLLNTAVTEFSIMILDVNLYDEGPYVCSILTNKKPESTKVHLIVQGKQDFGLEMFLHIPVLIHLSLCEMFRFFVCLKKCCQRSLWSLFWVDRYRLTSNFESPFPSLCN